MTNTDKDDDVAQQVAPGAGGDKLEAVDAVQDPVGRSANLSPPPPQLPAGKTTRNILKPPVGERAEQRKASVVSFQDKCEYREIELKPRAQRPDRPAALVSVRYYIMLVALVSPFVVTYSKTIINFAIIDMIHPDFVGQKSGSSGAVAPTTAAAAAAAANSTGAAQPADLPTTEAPATFPPPDDPSAYFDRDNSCPVSEANRERLLRDLTTDKKRARESSGEKFEWDTVRQGMLKAAYSIGHSLCSIVGGRLAEIFGSQRVMGLSSLMIGLSCLLAPLLASVHFYLLFGDLFLLGILGSFMTPALITLFANWLTPSEKSMMISFYLVSSRLGYALSSLLCGLLIDAQLSWRYLFYSAGWISFGFCALFMALARSRPADHPFISSLELDYLASKNMLVRESLARKERQADETVELRPEDEEGARQPTVGQPPARTKRKPATSAPWLAILTNVPVWAFIITKFCVKLAGDTMQIELPTYLNRVMHFSPKDNGFINSSNYVIFCLSCLLVGGLAKTANKRHPFGWSKTAVRKLFQATASFGVAIVLLGISFSVCNNTMTLLLLMLMFFLTTFGTGGEAQIPLDISERYAGTIHAIGSSLAISGAIEPILVGFLLRGHAADRNSWSTVWLGASAIAAFGGVVFLLFGDASKQEFDLIDPATGKRFPVEVVVVDQDEAEEKKRIQAEAAANNNGTNNGLRTGAGPTLNAVESAEKSYNESDQI